MTIGSNSDNYLNPFAPGPRLSALGFRICRFVGALLLRGIIADVGKLNGLG